MSDPFRYIFRFCCDPGFNDESELQSLDRYVREARIDDVAVFANVEELNTGHMTREEQDVYLRLMERVRDLLSGMGVTFSVNHWHSVMHADLGKRMDPSLGFRPMVDVEGNEAALCVCPLCEKWQRHIAGLYARYARLEPSILWVEDDFRLHNHAPLVWGGCFCEEHMRLYSERAGKTLTREEFLRGVLRPGPPHPYRKIWLDVSRETMLCAARAIGQAVRQASATAKVGLMSSVPQRPRRRGPRLARAAWRAGGGPAARGPHPPAGLSGAGPRRVSGGPQPRGSAQPRLSATGDRGVPGAGKLPLLALFQVAALHPLPAAQRPRAQPRRHHHRPV